MNTPKSRTGHVQADSKAGDTPPGDGFGNEIERMLMDRPMTRQSFAGVPAPMSSGIPGNTLDELMVELGMLRGERAEPPLSERQLGRTGTRGSAPRAPPSSVDGGALLLINSSDPGPLRPSTPRTQAAAAAAVAAAAAAAASPAPLLLPPAKGALPVSPASASSGVSLGVPGRSLSPMSVPGSHRRSITGASLGPSSSVVVSNSPGVGQVYLSGSGPPAGVLERQAQLEARLEKMESREQQLMGLVSQLQQQVSILSRAQQTTQQQLTARAATPSTSLLPQHPPQTMLTAADGRQATSSRPSTASSSSPAAPAAAAPGTPPQLNVADDDFIQNDEGDSPVASPRQRSMAAAAAAVLTSPPSQQLQRLGAPLASGGADGGSGAARSNKLVPSTGPPPEWEVDASQLRKELGALAANVVRLRDQLCTLVPGGPSPLAEEVAAQGEAEAQLKQNLTQIAMDVVSLHKGLTGLKQYTERSHTTLEKSINDVQLQIQTNALNALANGSPPGASGAGGGYAHPNAVAAALAATGGMTGSLEESLRSSFAKPAMRALPTFNTVDLGFMPDNAGAAAAVSAFGGMAAAGGGGGRRDVGGVGMNGQGGGGGGLGAALALLNSFEDQAAAEQAEQQKVALVTRQAVAIVDAKVRQVIVHVDRHMQSIAGDVEERLRMYEQTIIRMAQQIDRVQRVLRDIESSAMSRIVVRHGPGGREMDGEEGAAASGCDGGSGPPEPDPVPAAKENWVKMQAMVSGRFVPQKPEEKKPAAAGRSGAHGYFRAPP